MVQQTDTPTVEASVAPTPEASIDEPLLSEQVKAEIAAGAPTEEGASASPDATPATPAPPIPAVPNVEQLQTKISQYEQWISDARQAQAEQQQQQVALGLQDAGTKYKEYLIDKYSLDDSTASLWADEVAGLNRQVLETQMNQSAKSAYAESFSKQNPGVTAESLMQWNTVGEMQLAAESASKMARLEQQLTKMQETQKAAVPVGRFDSGRSSTGVGMPDQAWLTTVYGAGKSDDHARAAKIQAALGVFKP